MVKKKLTVSVIIPAYNEENRIGDCLKSISNQEEKPDEIIVVNNNSTDETVKIAKSFRVKVVNETLQGMIPARNRGFNEASGDIIARTDADTRVQKNWIKKIRKAFLKDENLVALSGPATFYDAPNPVKKTTLLTMLPIEIFQPKAFIKHDSLFGPNMAIRKSAWEKVKNEVCLEDKEVHEDIDLAIHLGYVGTIKFDPKLVVHSSIRRWKKLAPYFEYPYRSFRTIHRHKQTLLEIRSRRLVRGVLNRRKRIMDHLRHLPEYL